MDSGAYDDVDVDVDAEGELENEANGGGGMTLVDSGGLGALGVPPPSNAASNATSSALAGGGVGKRYRPAPAKTFQCRGYGECRMVFSRSEHLARHIRKHTGERPFTCHCSKQFSRLDNLRQHAQTVHADKAAQNEAMMRELTSLHASMTGGPPPASPTAPAAPAAASASTDVGGKTKAASPPQAGVSKRPSTKRARPSGAGVKREPVEDTLGGPGMSGGMGMGMTQRPGTSTGYEGAATAGYMDVDVDMDERPTQRQRQTQQKHDNPSPPPPGGARSFRGDSSIKTHSFRGDNNNGASFRQQDGGGFRDSQQSFLAAAANGNNNSYSGGRGESFRGPQFARRSPPAHTPSPPTPSLNGIGNGISHHRIPSGNFSSNRPFSSGNGAFPAANADTVPSGSSFPSGPFANGSGSRPSTGNGARLPPLSAVVSAAAFRPSSGHGLPAPGSGGSILLPNSLTLRRPSTGDWEWGDAWSVRPGTAPGKLAATAAADDSPFSFHPPEQPAASSFFSFNVGGGPAGGGNPRKRALGGPDGPYGAHPDDGDGGYEYGSESRPQSRRFSVMELCNDDVGEQQRPASSSVGLSSILRGGSAERERERPTTTSGLISRASALVLHDRDRDNGQQQREPQREYEPRQLAGEQQFAAEHLAAGNGGGGFGYGLGLGTGGIRGRDVAAPGGAAAAGARAGASGRGDGGVPPAAAAGGAGAGALLSSAAGAGAPHRGGALPSAAAAPAAGGAGVSRAVRTSPGLSPGASAARARLDGFDGDGDGGYGDGDDARVSPGAYGGHGPAGHGAGAGAGGRGVSHSPPAGAATAAAAAYRGGGGLAGAGLSGGFAGVPYAAAAASASAFASAPASPPLGAYRDSPPRADGARGALPGIAVFARVPAYAAGVPLRGDDAVLGVQRRFDDAGGLRYAPGGRAEVREFAAGAGRGPGSPGYDEYEYEHGPGHRVGGGWSGGMRV
ncbi:hypothetical protein B0H19DRAFT_1136770 [Mycena capillaripes]|nr:hypothetical protein B0H19DRAFT_1136770 [Mycena capillaripes]